MGQILKIDHPQFDGFLKRLLEKMESPSRIPRTSFFYKDQDDNQYVGWDEEKEHELMIREVLSDMDGIDTEKTFEWFKNLEDFCDCEHCQLILSLIRPKKISGDA